MKSLAITESEQSHGNANPTDNNGSNSNQLIEKTEIENTPFTIITIEENRSFVSMGKYRMSPDFETKEEAIENANSIDWEKIMNMIYCVTRETVKDIEDEKKIKHQLKKEKQ